MLGERRVESIPIGGHGHKGMMHSGKAFRCFYYKKKQHAVETLLVGLSVYAFKSRERSERKLRSKGIKK